MLSSRQSVKRVSLVCDSNLRVDSVISQDKQALPLKYATARSCMSVFPQPELGRPYLSLLQTLYGIFMGNNSFRYAITTYLSLLTGSRNADVHRVCVESLEPDTYLCVHQSLLSSVNGENYDYNA